MTLFEGDAGGAVVPCHYSTPSRPTNPNLAPPNAYGLIPKQRLRPNTRYSVEAVFGEGEKKISWSFTTAAR